ncbi:DUF1294 domain-containing protein [Sphingomonas lutea]|uniref:DUF1294 domain-containing protein n=1 Tax=Sphingomonas lutea TaxID=1045317 RepID=A0A7G9SGQ2_9SPHN|nr:DUF1294 domain-containing protein [Sphingomonas lutea]QNN67027.1 DUF1294 domain-containing protein [Sphingomonas lutea]
MTIPWTYALPALLFVNVWTYVSFCQDKRLAQKGLHRIPESNLLMLAALGGSPAALLARHRFRHKTRKQPFSTLLFVIIALQIGALMGWFVI